MAVDFEAKAVALSIDLDKVDWDAVNLPPGEDFGIISDEDDLRVKEEEEEKGFDNVIVVDGLPLVLPEKFNKLEGVIRNIFSGSIKEGGFWMPFDDSTRETLGYCFIEFNTAEEAEAGGNKVEGHRLAKYRLSGNLFGDIDRFMKLSDEWAPPEIQPYKPKEHLQCWLTDSKARDQFVIRAGEDTEILWNDARQSKPDPVYKRTFWTESFVRWSPLGTYLATVHHKGVAVWGGASTFERIMRYTHHEVKEIDFSPGEKFIVTYSSHVPSKPGDSHTVKISIFDTRTGRLKRDFKGSVDEFAVGGAGSLTGVSWPYFKWAGGRDDRYFARIGKNVVSVYETETFTLIDKKSIKVDNVRDFSWSPTDSILALYVPELGNQPARVSLYQIPSKVEIRQKNLFSVSDCKMYWQSNGEYLAVKVDRYTKTKKSTYTGFELFRIKERDIPIEVLELENKNDKIIAFAWEPKGHRFGVIHGDDMSSDISFYSMKTAHHTSRVSKLTTLKNQKLNSLYWSPGGRYIVLAGLKGFDGQLEFYNVDELETMGTTEHYKCTDIEWDPTGRYVATAVTSVHNVENGVNIWSFYGNLLYRILKDRFQQFQWRPRPPSLLSPEKEEEIAKNIKKYSKKYKIEDQDVSLMLSEQELERRRLLKEGWESWVSRWSKHYEEEKLERLKLRGGEVSEEEEVYEANEVEYEEEVGVIEEIV